MKAQTTRLALLSVILLTSPLLVLVQEQPSKEHTLSRSEVKALIKSASTPEDHLTLASYFRDLASQEEATAKFHDQMAETYQEKPLPSGYGPATVNEMRRHCRYFAENARKAAKTEIEMAEQHQRIARWMREAPATGPHHNR